jgi:hypothetical protein
MHQRTHATPASGSPQSRTRLYAATAAITVLDGLWVGITLAVAIAFCLALRADLGSGLNATVSTLAGLGASHLYFSRLPGTDWSLADAVDVLAGRVEAWAGWEIAEAEVEA